MDKQMFKGVSTKNALLSLFTIMIFALIIYLSLLYGAANALAVSDRFTVQAVYSVGIAVLIAMTAMTWLICGKEK